MSVGQDLRLSSKGVISTTREFTVDRANVLGDMGESLVKEVGTGLHYGLELVLGFPCRLPGIFKVFLGAAKFVFNTLESVHGTSIRCHLVEITVQDANLLKKFILDLVIRILKEIY